MKIKNLLLGSVLWLTLPGSYAAAQTTVVNFSFAPDFNASSYAGQGAVADAGHDYWNRVGSNTTYVNVGDDENPDYEPAPGPYAQDRSTMFASDGATLTSLRIVFADDSFANGNSALFAPDLYNAYFFGFTTPETFTISGLTAGQSYDFYFYSASGDSAENRAATFTLDGNTVGLTAAILNSFSEGDNYVKITVTPGGTTLNGSFQGTVGEADFSGLQIVTTATAVPEPSSYAAISGCVALAGMVVYRRRRTE